MIYIFNEYYKAISNIFIRDIEGNDFVYPAPLHLSILMEENEKENKQTVLELKVNSYSDSFLHLDKNFSFFAYLLNQEYIIKCIYIGNLIKDSLQQDVGGYRGRYKFSTDSVAMNIGLTDVYDKYVKVKEQYITEEIIDK